jgi:hypothetical protein
MMVLKYGLNGCRLEDDGISNILKNSDEQKCMGVQGINGSRIRQEKAGKHDDPPDASGIVSSH